MCPVLDEPFDDVGVVQSAPHQRLDLLFLSTVPQHIDGQLHVLVVHLVLLCLNCLFMGLILGLVPSSLRPLEHHTLVGIWLEEDVEGVDEGVSLLERLEDGLAEDLEEAELSSDAPVEGFVNQFFLHQSDDVFAFQVLVARSHHTGTREADGGKQEKHAIRPLVREHVIIPALEPVVLRNAELINVLPLHFDDMLDVSLQIRMNFDLVDIFGDDPVLLLDIVHCYVEACFDGLNFLRGGPLVLECDELVIAFLVAEITTYLVGVFSDCVAFEVWTTLVRSDGFLLFFINFCVIVVLNIQILDGVVERLEEMSGLRSDHHIVLGDSLS